MRNIKADLEERLREVVSERQHMQVRLALLDEREKSITDLIDAEEARWVDSAQFPLFPSNGNGKHHKLTSPVSRFVMAALGDGSARSLHDLKGLAREKGVNFGNKAPGRVLHFALLGMEQNQMIVRIEGGMFRIPD